MWVCCTLSGDGPVKATVGRDGVVRSVLLVLAMSPLIVMVGGVGSTGVGGTVEVVASGPMGRFSGM